MFDKIYSDHIICPNCNSSLKLNDLKCIKCKIEFLKKFNIPLLFIDHNFSEEKGDVINDVKKFYEKTPFPDYEKIESILDLINKAEKSFYVKFLNDEIPFNAKVLEVGCGTGQLSNYLSTSGRLVFGTDMCINSLRLAENFRQNNNLPNTKFIQMNLFKPVFKPRTFDLVICQGVLHHTSDPYQGFLAIQKLVKPGGYIIIGLYNFFGRLITDVRRMIFNLTKDSFKFLDPRLSEKDRGKLKRESWFNDQYKHPHESKHTVSEVLEWFDINDYKFINAIPKIKPFDYFTSNEKLFKQIDRGNSMHHIISQLKTIITGYKEGGLFIMIGRKK